MERFPANPEELRAEERAAQAAVQQEADERLAQTHEHPAHSTARFVATSDPAALDLDTAAAHGLKSAERVDSLQRTSETESTAEAELQAALANLPVWNRQFTMRGLFIGVILGGVFCIVTHKLSLTLGIIPSLNVASGLLAFVFLRAIITACTRLGMGTRELTQQEVNVVQTFITAASGVAFTGGFGTERVLRGEVSFVYCPSDEQLADVFTKALSEDRFLRCISRLGMS